MTHRKTQAQTQYTKALMATPRCPLLCVECSICRVLEEQTATSMRKRCSHAPILVSFQVCCEYTFSCALSLSVKWVDTSPCCQFLASKSLHQLLTLLILYQCSVPLQQISTLLILHLCVTAELERADAVVYGMGSLYTSICPILCLEGMGEAIVACSSPKVCF